MITTSRYASLKTRTLAKSMADENGEIYVARGKKTIDALAAYARRVGEGRITLIEEKGGIAHTLALIDVDARGGWSWTEERLLKIAEKDS